MPDEWRERTADIHSVNQLNPFYLALPETRDQGPGAFRMPIPDGTP
jgi:hypothetical protein